MLNYRCQLWKNLAIKIQGLRHKAKKICTAEFYKIKLSIYKLWNQKNQLILIELLYNKLESYKKKRFVIYKTIH